MPVPPSASRSSRAAQPRHQYPHRNALLRSVCCRGEREFVPLNDRWRTLCRITGSPGKVSDITRTALVLTHFEHGCPK